MPFNFALNNNAKTSDKSIDFDQLHKFIKQIDAHE